MGIHSSNLSFFVLTVFFPVQFLSSLLLTSAGTIQAPLLFMLLGNQFHPMTQTSGDFTEDTGFITLQSTLTGLQYK